MNKLEKLLNDSKTKQQVKQCCACKKIKTYNGYIAVPEPVLKEIKNNHPISHGYCKPCLNDQLIDITVLQRIYDKGIREY